MNRDTIVRSLQGCYPSLHATLVDELDTLQLKHPTLHEYRKANHINNLWDDILNVVNPSARLEQYALMTTMKTSKIQDVIPMQKHVRNYLIRVNSTILDAFEKNKLETAILHVEKHPTTYKKEACKLMNWATHVEENQTPQDTVEEVTPDNLYPKGFVLSNAHTDETYIVGSPGRPPKWVQEIYNSRLVKNVPNVSKTITYEGKTYTIGQRGRIPTFVLDLIDAKKASLKGTTVDVNGKSYTVGSRGPAPHGFQEFLLNSLTN